MSSFPFYAENSSKQIDELKFVDILWSPLKLCFRIKDLSVQGWKLPWKRFLKEHKEFSYKTFPKVSSKLKHPNLHNVLDCV